MRASITWAVAAVSVATLSAPALAQQTFNDRAAFSAATTGTTTVDFNGEPAGTESYQGTSYSEGGVNFTADGIIYTIGNGDAGGQFTGGDTYGSSYFEWEGGFDLLTVNLPGSATAVGFDFVELRGNALDFLVTIDGVSTTVTSGPSALFFGSTAQNPFTIFTIQGLTGGAGLYPTIDNLTFGAAAVAAAPEPASWAMMIGGFGAAGAALRRRRKPALAHA